VWELISIIHFTENAFEVVRVGTKTANYTLQHLPEVNPVFPPNLPDPDDPGVTKVVTHCFMYLPTAYTPLILCASGYTAKQVWEIL